MIDTHKAEPHNAPVYPIEDIELTSEEIGAVYNGIMAGAAIGDIFNMSKETIEGLYTLAYNQYVAGNFADAAPLFKVLCLYKHTETRFWMGLAGCRQALNDLPGAIDAYSMAGMMESLDNPEPFLLAGMCFIKMGNRQKAIDVLKGAVVLGKENNPEHLACREKINHLLTMLRQEV